MKNFIMGGTSFQTTAQPATCLNDTGKELVKHSGLLGEPLVAQADCQ